MAYAFGIDIGGTFTDIVCRGDDGSLRIAKLPTTRADPSRAVLAALDIARTDWGIAPASITRFTHGTTVATNAVLERKGARIGLITTQGFKDVLEIGRQMRHQMYDLILKPEVPVFLAPGNLRKEVSERIDAQGHVVTKLDDNSVRAAVQALLDANVEAIAVCLIFSFLHPAHEQRIEKIIAEMAPHIPVSLSSNVDPAFREYERTCVTAFDAYIKPIVARYLANLESGLTRTHVTAPLQVMQSRGGLMSSAIARRRPVRLFLSGPAGGVVGGMAAGAIAGFDNLITVDIGGTSCDIALISGGAPLIRGEGRIDGFPVRVPMVDVTAIGAGGGSIAWRDGAGSLRVGPHSAGSEPGPACYGRGGEQPTVTDASVVLGYIDPKNFAGGAIALDARLAHAAIARVIANPMGIGVEQAALGIHRVLNAQMGEAMRLISVGRGIDPRGYALLPLGGGGPMHGCALAEDLGITTILIPPHPGVLAAAGLLGAPVEHEVANAFPQPLTGLDPQTLRAPLAALDAACAALMRDENISTDKVKISHTADICYIGQSYHLEVPIDLAAPDPITAMIAAFHTAHERVYGHATDNPAKIVNLRTVHSTPAGIVAAGATQQHTATPPTTRLIHVRQSPAPVTAAIWQRSALPADTDIPGPAIIEQLDTTTLVEPGWIARATSDGTLLITRRPTP